MPRGASSYHQPDNMAIGCKTAQIPTVTPSSRPGYGSMNDGHAIRLARLDFGATGTAGSMHLRFKRTAASSAVTGLL